MIDLLTILKHGAEADPTLHGIVVAHEEEQDIAQKVQQNIAKGSGILIMISIGNAANTEPDAPGPSFSELPVLIDITENTLLNRGKNGLTALQIATRLAWWFHAPNHTNAAATDRPPESVRALAATVASIAKGQSGPILNWQLRLILSHTLQQS
jgi:hypothetical protein